MTIKLHKKGIALSREERIKEDENLRMIENSINGFQSQVNELVVSGDSSVEAAQARVRVDGTVAATLKERLDVEHQEVTAQLAEEAQEIEYLKADKAEKSYVESEIVKKVDQTIFDNAINSKVDKDAPGVIPWAMLGQDARENISGNKTAVVAENSVLPVSMTNGAAEFLKRSRLGELATITFGASATTLPDLDITARKLTFSDTFFIINGKQRYTVSGGVVLDYSNLGAATGLFIYFNTATQSFLILSQTNLSGVPESCILFASIYFNTARTELLGFNISCKTTVNGVDTDLYFLEKKNDLTSFNKDLAVVYIGASGVAPNYDSTARTLTFASTFFIVRGKNRYTVTDGAVLDFSTITASAIAVHYDTENGTFLMNSPNQLANIPKKAALIAILSTGNLPQAEFKHLHITCQFTVDGKSPYSAAQIKEKPYVFAQEPLIGSYEVGDLPAGDGSDPEGFNHRTVTHVDIYQKIDELLAPFPEYALRTEFGKDTSGQIPIYSYHLTPKQPNASMREKGLPKIIIAAGAHGDGHTFTDLGDGSNGDPPTNVFALYYFLKDLIENWQEDKLLEYIRWNVELIIIPLQNPWGFDNRSRYNSRGVDLNRNYDYGWSLSERSGSAPFSEKETQYMRDLLIQHKDAVHFCDYHAIGTRSGRIDSELMDIRINFGGAGQYISNESIGRISRMWKGKYNLDNLDFYGTIVRSPQTLSPIAKNWAEYKMGIFSTTLESFPSSLKIPLHSSDVIKMNTEFIGNWVISVLKYFQNK